MAVRILMAQMQATLGDVKRNGKKILNLMEEAVQKGADILLTPELSLCGYPPEDLIERREFLENCADELHRLTKASERFPSLTSIVGFPEITESRPFNSVAVIHAGKVVAIYRKACLPNYGVFDERRYFRVEEVPQPVTFTVKGHVFGVCICEDVWFKEPAQRAKKAGAQTLLVPNASPYEGGKLDSRIKVIRENLISQGLSVVYVNEAGGQDEILFDGRSMAMDQDGLKALLPAFEESGEVVEIGSDNRFTSTVIEPPQSTIEELYKALVTGLRSYYLTNGFKGIVLGLSGGIDSALVAKISVDAIGKDKVEAVMMPSAYTADMSREDAEKLAKNLGIRYEVIAIAPAFSAFNAMLKDRFEGFGVDVTEENLQARIRGTLLMAISNKTGKLLTATGNKSEMAVGYSTLYGDLAGGYAPIKDVWKTEVFALCRYINERAGYPLIPTRIITRPPSAELREDQKDEDSLPPYPVLDAILSSYVEKGASPEDIIQSGYDPETVKKVLAMLQRAEYKRRQSPIGTKVSKVAFGRDWRYPVSNSYKPLD